MDVLPAPDSQMLPRILLVGLRHHDPIFRLLIIRSVRRESIDVEEVDRLCQSDNTLPFSTPLRIQPSQPMCSSPFLLIPMATP